LGLPAVHGEDVSTYRVQVVWVLGHMGIDGNEIAD